MPDVSDSDIRAMVLRDHAPQEHRTISGVLLIVACRACFKEWPCPDAIAAQKQAQPELQSPLSDSPVTSP